MTSERSSRSVTVTAPSRVIDQLGLLIFGPDFNDRLRQKVSSAATVQNTPRTKPGKQDQKAIKELKKETAQLKKAMLAIAQYPETGDRMQGRACEIYGLRFYE